MHLKRWQQITWRWLLGVLATLVLLVALLIGLFRTLAPVVPGYRARTEAWASRLLDRPVSIASMGAQWGLYGPELTLDQVQLFSHDGQRVLVSARQIRIGFTLSAIFHGRFARPDRLILVLPRVTVQRNLDGSYGIVGLEGSVASGIEKTGWRQVVTEAFAQEGQVLMLDGSVTLMDMRRPSAPLVFNGIRININNTLLDHRVAGRMQLPASLGQTLAFAVQVKGAGDAPQAWRWQAQAAGRSLDLPQWLAYWPAYDGHFRSGQLDLRAALDGLGGQVQNATLSVDARRVAADSPESGFDLLAGNISWVRDRGGWTLQGRDLQLRRGADVWPVSQFNLRRQDPPAKRSGWSGNASFVRLQDIVQLSAWLPSGTSGAIARLQSLAPSGDVHALKFSALRSGQELSAWSLNGRFEDLAIQPDGKIPGFNGLSGDLVADQNGGSLTLSGDKASVTFAHLFRGPLPLSTLNAALRFHHDAQGWHFDLTKLDASTPDVAHASAEGTLLLPADGGSPSIDLQASAENTDARNKSIYLPVGIMPKEVVEWLDRAIIAGQAPNASLELRGKLDDFPYDKGQGLFDIRFRLLHGTLDYADGWPPVTGLDADVEFKNQGMSAKLLHGQIMQDDISGTTAQFADLRNGMLAIKGTARGSAQTALRFLREGPLKDRFGHVLDQVQVAGGADVSLDLKIPVEHPEQYTLDGGVRLRDAGVQLAGLPKWPVTALNGVVKITQDGVSARQVQGQFLGAPLELSLQPDAGHDATQITATGGVQAAELTAGMSAEFQRAVTGETTWQLTGTLPNRPAESGASLALALSSGLQGLDLSLPAPFSKPADQSAPLRASIKLDTGAELQAKFNYNDLVDGLASLSTQNGSWRFDRGEVAFGGAAASLPQEPGLKVTGTLPEFSLSAWKALLPAAEPGGLPVSPGQLLAADLTIGDFFGFDQHIKNLHLQLTRTSDAWKIGLASLPLAGTVSWPFQPDAAHPIVADMQRVEITRKPATGQSEPPPKFDPKDVPPLTLSVKQFHYNGARLADLHAELLPMPDGVKLKALSVADPSFKLQASGEWVTQENGGASTQLIADLKSTNVERTLQAFGFAPALSGNQGELQADLHWPGGPFAEILPHLGGKLHVLLRHGSLLDVKPGAGRVFGLLSINALPRRLLLNFGDVLGKGFAYDSIEGNFTLDNGDAYTPDMTISGPAANIQMVGRTGLAKRDFDEAVVVMPSVGSTLPVLGAIAGGVGVGAVVFLLTEIFKKPLSQVGETRYHLSGTWDNPKLTEIPAPQPAAGSSP